MRKAKYDDVHVLLHVRRLIVIVFECHSMGKDEKLVLVLCIMYSEF